MPPISTAGILVLVWLCPVIQGVADDYLRRITDVTVAVLKASRGATWQGAAANTADVKSAR